MLFEFGSRMLIPPQILEKMEPVCGFIPPRLQCSQTHENKNVNVVGCTNKTAQRNYGTGRVATGGGGSILSRR